MAGGIISNWKLTLDPTGTPLVLVTYGDKLLDEIQFSASRGYQVIPLVRAAAPRIQDGKNVSYTLGISRYDQASTDADARKALMQAMITALTGTPKELKLEVSGITDRYWKFAKALVTDYAPGKYVGASKPRRVTSLNIIATTLTEVAVP
jgi:hypothetical protein